jgi:excisionase family DNA binding protein
MAEWRPANGLAGAYAEQMAASDCHWSAAVRVREVAERLEVSQATVYALIASGKLRCYRIGNGRGLVRISEAQLQAFLKASELTGDAPPALGPAPRLKLKHLNLG